MKSLLMLHAELSVVFISLIRLCSVFINYLAQTALLARTSSQYLQTIIKHQSNSLSVFYYNLAYIVVENTNYGQGKPIRPAYVPNWDKTPPCREMT